MTATAFVSIDDTFHPFSTVATIVEGPGSLAPVPSGIFCNGALTDPDGQFLYLSLIGRDTSLQELRGKMTTSKLASFTIKWDRGGKLDGWFSHSWLGAMEYHGSKIQTALFGELTQMVLYHPLMTTPDKANQTAIIPYTGATPVGQCYSDLWQVVKNICEVPLLDGWRKLVVAMFGPLGWMQPLVGFNCGALHAKLGKDMAAVISANVRSGALCADGSTDMDKLTYDPEYGRTPPEPVPSEPPQGEDGGDGFWDGAEVMDVYSRAQAIADCDLVDVSDTSEAREAGFRVPVALTRAVWERYAWWENDQAPPKQRSLGQSTAGRLWDILYMAALAAKSHKGGGSLLYKLFVIPCDGRSTQPREITLKLHSGAGDRGEHVITIMLPNED